MADQFDLDSYLAQREADFTAVPDSPYFTPKQEALVKASARKKTELSERVDEHRRALAANANALTGRLGLDPTGVLGNVVNDVAGMVSEGSALAGTVAGTGVELLGMLEQQQTDSAVQEAFQREQLGQASEADRALLDQPVRRNIDPERVRSNREVLQQALKAARVADNVRQASNLEQLVAMDEETGQRESSTARRVLGDSAVAFGQGSAAALEGLVGLGSLVSQGRAGELAEEAGFRPREGVAALESWLSPEQQQVNQQVEAADGFSDTLGEALDNPSFIANAIVKSVPSMAAGGVIGRGVGAATGLASGTAAAIGEGAIMAGQSAEGMRQQTEDGRLSLKQALLAGSVGVAGAGIARLGNSLSHRLGVGDVDQALVDGALEQTRRSLPVATLLSGAVEGGEEVLQSGTEQLAENAGLERPLDHNLGDAMAQGLVTGAPMGVLGAGRPAEEPPEVTEADLQAMVQPGERFNPSAALAVIERQSLQPQASADQLQSHLDTLGTLRTSLESQLEASTPEKVSEAEAKHARRMAQLDKIEASIQALPEDEGKLQQLTELANKRLAFENELAAAQALPAQRDALQAQLDAVVAAQDTVKGRLPAPVQTLKTDLELADREVQALDPAEQSKSQAAAERLVSLAMTDPEYLTPEAAQQLADNTSNGLTAPQRAVLRTFAEAKALEHQLKSLEGVRTDIFEGGPGYKGLTAYRQDVAQALSRKQPDFQATRRTLAQLENFLQSRQAKRDLANKSMARVRKNGGQEQWLPQKNGQWLRADRFYDRQEMYALGGMTLHSGSQPYVDAINLETQAVEATLKALRAQANARLQQVKAAQPAATLTPTPTQAPAKAPAPAKAAPKAQAPAATPPTRDYRALYQAALQHGDTPAGQQAQSTLTALDKRIGKTLQQIGKLPAERRLQELDKFEAELAKRHVDWEYHADQLELRDTLRTEAQAASAPEAEPQANAEEGAEPTSRPETPEQPTPETVESEPAEAVEPAEPNEAEPVDGTLTLFMEPLSTKAADEDINSWFQRVNLVRHWYQQHAGARDNDDVLVPVKGRPLVLEADFLSSWEEDPQLPFHYLPEHFQKADDKARGALIQFQRLARDWQSDILSSLKVDFNDDYRFADPFYYLVNREEDGSLSLDENLVTAMTVAGSGWLAERVAGGPFSTDREINGLFGRDSKYPVQFAERAMLSDKGVLQDLVINALGQRLLDALGLKGTQAPEDFKAKLTASAGAHVAGVLLRQGLLEQVTVSFADLRKNGIELGEMRPDPQTGELKVQGGGLTFLRPAVSYQTREQVYKGRTKQRLHPVFLPAVETVTGMYRDSGNILGALFGVANALQEPEKASFQRRSGTTSNTRQNEPAALAKVLATDVQKPWTIRKDLVNVLEQLNPVILQRMQGIEVDLTRVPRPMQASVVAKNDAKQRDHLNSMAFIEKLRNSPEGEDTLLYMDRSVWKQHRVGMDGNVLNPQASKDHRHKVAMRAWNVRIDPSQPSAVLDQFKLAVLEGLGHKTDKQSNAKSLAEFERWIQQDSVKPVLEALAKAQHEDAGLSSAVQHDLLALVEEGGEELFSLDALLNASEYLWAKQNGRTFQTAFFREVDGKTNGSMLAHLQLMPFASLDEAFTFLRRGGFYRQGDPFFHYSEYRSAPGNVDIYEAVVRSVYNNVHRVLQAQRNLVPQYQALWQFIGHPLKNPKDVDSDISSAGRNLVKTPTTGVVYGSGMGGTLNGMKAEFQQKIFERLHKLALGKPTGVTDDTAAVWLEDLNTLLRSGKAPEVKLPADIDQLLELELSPVQQRALDKVYTRLMYQPVKQAMDSHFGKFMERRNLVNRATRTLFHLYSTAYEALKQAEIDRLMESGELPYFEQKNDQGEVTGRVPRHGLLAEQEKVILDQLVNLFPMVHSPFSVDSNDPSQGVPMTKSERSLSDAPQYQGQAQFSKGFLTLNNGKTSSSLSYSGFSRQLINPGVAGMVLLTQSTDSAISAWAYEKLNALNVHDAHGLGLADAEQGAKNLNQATFEVMANYSMLEQVEASLYWALDGFEKLLKDPEVAPLLTPERLMPLALEFADDSHDAQEKGVESADGRVMRTLIWSLNTVRKAADQMKLDFLKEVQSFDQYSMEGGAYRPSTADQTMLEDLQQKLAAEPLLSIDTAATDALIQQAFDRITGKAKQPDAAIDDRFDEQAGPVERPAAAQSAAWGQLGTSRIAHDAELVAFFQANPQPALKDLVRVLRSRIEAMPAGRTQAYYRELWKQLVKTVDSRTEVQYVTADTALPEGIDLQKADSSRGLYAFTASSGRLYVKSPQFKYSGITVEMLLHELTHVAVARLLDQAEQGQAPADVLALKDELQRLLDKARLTAREQQLEQRYVHGLSNLQEFVAWGMTHPEFQRDILNAFSIKSATSQNRLVQAAKAFVQLLRDLLYRGSDKSRQKIQVQGLSQLLANVGGLMQAVREQQADASAADTGLTVLAYGEGGQYLDLDELFDALGQSQPVLAPQDSQRLQSLLASLVKPLHGPFGVFRLEVLQGQAGTAPQQFLDALVAGEAPFASTLHSTAGLPDQVAFVAEQLEVTVRTALSSQDRGASLLQRELKRLYDETYARYYDDLAAFHAGDWAQATPGEQQQAAALRDAFLAIPAGQGASDYLSRFAALGLSHPQLNRLLQAPTARDALNLQGLSLAEKLSRLLEQLVRLLAGKLTHTWAGQAGDAKLNQLVKQLVRVEAKYREAQLRPRSEWLNQLENVMDQVGERGREAVNRLAESDLIKKSRFTSVRVLGKVTALAGQARVDEILTSGLRLRERLFTGHYGFIAGTVNEMQSVATQFMNLLRLAKHNEQHRKHLSNWTMQQLLESFADRGRSLQDEDRAALGYLLRTDAASLVADGMSLEELRQLLLQDARLSQQMDALSQQLLGFAEGRLYVRRAKALGVFMTTQQVTIRNPVFNAQAIAEGHASLAAGTVPSAAARQAEPLIDRLASLQALASLPTAQRQRLADLIQRESQRTDGGNGIDMTLRMHRALQQDARSKLFQGRELFWMKGYLPEVTDPRVELAWADEQEGKELLAQGWERVSDPLQQDPLDPSRPRGLYQLRGRGPLRWQSGALSLTGMRAKGTTLKGQATGLSVGGRYLSDRDIAEMDRRNRVLESQAATGMSASSRQERLAAPLLDERGNVVDYRYLMTAEVRDSLLKRNNDFAQLLGNLSAQTYDKYTAAEQNRTVIQALHDHWQEAVARGEKAFITIGKDSKDEEGQELWRLLPDASKADLRAIWGGDFMLVPTAQYDLIAGYRKLSAANVFDKANDWLPAYKRNKLGMALQRRYEKDMRTLHEQLLVWLTRDVLRLGDRAALRVRQAEDIWQAIVQEVKDIVVIRSGMTLFWNMVSNLTLLWWQGVPMKDIVRNHWVAWRGAVNYRKDSQDRFRLENELAMGAASNPDEHRRRIRQLEDALSRNPARELIEAGMLPTIVEDVALEGDDYSYRSMAREKLDSWTGWVPQQVRSTVATLYMAPGTSLHRGMSLATQYSDFVARYTLYQHLTQRSKAPMSHAEALEEISDAFINYDVPSERKMQYLNDMGLLMFTKYYLRIQRVILKQFREKPARGLLLVLLNNYLSGMQMIMDSGFWGRLGNPLEWGALQFPGSLDELATIGGLTALWK